MILQIVGSIDGIDNVIHSERSAAAWDNVKQSPAHLKERIKKQL